ncbi:RagB/SusD family nutrient uptake outer membrane protein [uncultured Chitinophaga sp.]|uniref:RagB/SusD family nutrient uptake outer membrane protein n=1 Tax=uncultured Chitinophaga sp. TaxID=339340 RepID=UPI0025EF773C|nr:RagB/SusD family nutrient uptake outer membrane protein [uncultured Chitinophaga sp.]
MNKRTFIYRMGMALIAAVLFTACQDKFLEEDFKAGYSGDAIIDDAGFRAAIAGLQTTFRNNDYSSVQGGLASLAVGTDIAVGGQIVGAYMSGFQDYKQLIPQDASAKFHWTWCYKIINLSNNIIQAANGPAVTLTTAQKALYIAEASFYRGYAYNFLSILFGGVPVLTAPVTAPKTDYVRATKAEVLRLIISDLKYASENLPDISKVASQGRINQAAALQLLAEAYLRAGKGDSAEIATKAIIGSNLFSLVKARYGINKDKPGDPFYDMFVYGNQRRSQGNTEAIWVVEQQYNVNGGGLPADNTGDQHRREWVPFYVNVSGMLVADSLGGRGIGRIRPTNWWVYQLYEPNDMRNSPYNLRRNYYYNNPANARYGQRVVLTGNLDTTQNAYAHNTKWYYSDPSDVLVTNTYKDRIMMRLAETYLLQAEAQLMQNKTDDAAISINEVRTRANVAGVSGAQVTLDFILDERARELTGEENRRLTLARTETLVARTKKYNPVAGPTIMDHNNLLPIPQSEIDLNKDAKLEQNPDYIK